MKPAIPDRVMDLSVDFTEFEEKMILYNSRKFGMNYKIFN